MELGLLQELSSAMYTSVFLQMSEPPLSKSQDILVQIPTVLL